MKLWIPYRIRSNRPDIVEKNWPSATATADALRTLKRFVALVVRLKRALGERQLRIAHEFAGQVATVVALNIYGHVHC